MNSDPEEINRSDEGITALMLLRTHNEDDTSFVITSEELRSMERGDYSLSNPGNGSRLMERINDLLIQNSISMDTATLTSGLSGEQVQTAVFTGPTSYSSLIQRNTTTDPDDVIRRVGERLARGQINISEENRERIRTVLRDEHSRLSESVVRVGGGTSNSLGTVQNNVSDRIRIVPFNPNFRQNEFISQQRPMDAFVEFGQNFTPENRKPIVDSSDNLSKESYNTLLRQLYGLPVELPKSLVVNGIHANFVSFEEADNMISKNKIERFFIDSELQPWSGPPSTQNRIVTLFGKNGITYLVKARYYNSDKLLPPI
jgi:hypothetical protein